MNIKFFRMRKLRNNEDGSATIEFVLLFPMIMFLFLTGFEAGYYMLRNVMLERAVDIAVRDVRLSNGQVPGFAALKKRICDEAAILPNCMRNLQVEMRPVRIQAGAVASVQGPARCVDVNSTANPLDGTLYETGQENQLMVVRVCALSQPMFPSTQLGLGMRANGNGDYALVATTAFVTEPGDRSTAPGGAGGSGGMTNGNN